MRLRVVGLCLAYSFVLQGIHNCSEDHLTTITKIGNSTESFLSVRFGTASFKNSNVNLAKMFKNYFRDKSKNIFSSMKWNTKET